MIAIIFTIAFLFFIVGIVAVNRKWNSGNLCLWNANASKPLDIPTYDGGNQGLHPSCLYFKNGWGGHLFWFVFTPYKDRDDAIENPCIYYSDDGINFTPIQGAYPIDDIQYSKEEEYNSDPEFVYNPDTNEIECWWRRVQTNLYPGEQGRNLEILYRSRSDDGIHWTEKETMFVYKNTDDTTHGIISPALIYENGIYKMWASNGDNKPEGVRTIDYYEMLPGSTFKLVHSTELIGKVPHHLDVWKEGDTYYLIGFDCTKSAHPYVVYSFDNPCGDMHYVGVVLTRGRMNRWDDGQLYRPSVTKVNEKFYLYYSAYMRKNSNYCHTGLIVFRSIKQLKRNFI